MNGIAYSFPSPTRLAVSKIDALRKLGFSRQKGHYLIELSNLVARRKIDLEGLETLDRDQVLQQLYELQGVGRWTAEYVTLRGLGRLSVFPGDDVGARKNLQRLLSMSKPLDYNALSRILKRWDPFGGLIYFHLLLESLTKQGYL